jgi:hypothetical protein
MPPPPEISPLTGIVAAYILPTVEPATLWRHDDATDRFVPAGELPAFTSLAISRLVPEHGMAQVTTPGGDSGFVYASRLAAGDAAAAERARCIFEAGPTPANNEILARHGTGAFHLLVENRRDQPAVVKLRGPDGALAVGAFVAPLGTVELDNLPAGPYRIEFAFGELWSHGCRRFVAGMRAQSFTAPGAPGAAGMAAPRFVIPPGDAIDEPDANFDRE